MKTYLVTKHYKRARLRLDVIKNKKRMKSIAACILASAIEELASGTRIIQP